MPELPELDVVCEVLHRRVIGKRIVDTGSAPKGASIIVRDFTQRGLAGLLEATFDGVFRRGKFLVFTLTRVVQNPGDKANGEPCATMFVVINPKLTGRLQLCMPTERRGLNCHIWLSLSDGRELRYVDQKTMGQIYLGDAAPEHLQIPDYSTMGPEPLAVTRADFLLRIKPFRGEIKGILTRSEFLAGIGNAYADEILWTAKLHPYRKRTSLDAAELDRLYGAIVSTLTEATTKVRVEMGENIHLKPRDFMNVHMKTGQPCPRCGTTISLIGANQRITNFCRACQPGGLIKGM